MEKKKVLFVCVHNSARSQMAEAYLNHYGQSLGFTAESAGLEPGTLNPFVVRALEDDRISIKNATTNSVFDFYKEGRLYHYVITVCDQEAAQKCPIFPGHLQVINWSFPDPSAFKGSDDDIFKKTCEVRDAIKTKIQDFIKQHA